MSKRAGRSESEAHRLEEEKTRAAREPLLATKLNPPILRSDIVARPRLLERLERDVRRPLTLVSAPAGYGKSTLVAQWLESSSLPGVWLSLDERDDDLRSFLGYFVAAVRRHAPRACPGAHDLLDAGELPAPAPLANLLANELERIQSPFILALDDYHRVSEPDIHELLNRLLEHPPRSLHLAVLTRRDPPLPFGAMRAGGLAVEIREADLQFSAEETRNVFRSTAEVALDGDSLAKVMRELEGWIVGLRLVCLSLRDREDPKAYLSGLHGDLVQVQEYLVEQVLSRQPAELEQWLLRTSILDRFCASLCEAVCADDRPGLAGEEFIQLVSAANLFTIDLDSRGEWLRYHHLFQQLLRRLLEARVGPEQIRALHGRACRWFEAKGLVDDALKHALLADEIEAAADIVEKHRVGILNADRWPVLASWLSRLPEEVVWRRPELLLGEAWLAYYRFRIPALVRIVERLDELLREGPPRPAWEGELAMFQSFLCYWQGKAREMLTHVGVAREALPPTHDLARADAEIYFGLAHHLAGQEEVALDELTRQIRERPEQEGLRVTRQVITLAFVHLLSGRLNEGAIHSRQLGELARVTSPIYITSWSTYLLGCCLFQSGDWAGAERSFRWMAEHRYVGHTAAVMSSFTGLGLTLRFLGRAEESAEVAQRLVEFAIETKDPENLAIAESGRARILRQKERALALPSAESSRTASESMATSFLWVELPVVTRCRLLLDRNSPKHLEEALATIERLENAAAEIHNTFQRIDLVALKAVALEKLDRSEEAIATAHRALELAAPGEWLRPFLELGAPMAELLVRLREHEDRAAQVERILGRFAEQQPGSMEPWPGSPAPEQALVESLTNRELDVLERLARRLYDKEIAAELHVSLSTVKTHLRNIYQKLAVGSRRQAVIRAEKLGLFETG